MAKVDPFHTDTEGYEPDQRQVYHDEDECQYGKEIKRDGNNVAGKDGRERCKRCIELRPVE